MRWSHLSSPALGLTHSQQPENFGLCIKPCFAHHEKPSMAAEARIQVLVFCTPSTLHCPSPSKPLAATMPWWCLLASWVCMAALPLGIIPPGAGVTAHSTRCCFSKQTALHKLLQVFQTKGAVQIRVGCFTSFHIISPSGNIWTLLLKATASHGNFWFCRSHYIQLKVPFLLHTGILKKILWHQLSQALQHLFCTSRAGLQPLALLQYLVCAENATKSLLVVGSKYPS